MPKYYVSILTHDNKKFEQTLNAADPLDACVLTWERLRIIPKWTSWKVSERGYDRHDDDMFFGWEMVVDGIKKFQKKRKNGP
jgi:hypothetical protein